MGLRKLRRFGSTVVRQRLLNHRGRHQAQGSDIPEDEGSCDWVEVDPYPATKGHADLSGVEAGLAKAARERREKCFKLAHRFITNAKNGGGVEPTSRSWPAARPHEDGDVRVDIEVKKGRAFV